MAEYQYRNIVELLVEQETEHQLSKLPLNVTGSIPSIQVVTYVLNRLKPFYACTERGFEEQLKRAEHELRLTIRQGVHTAIQTIYQHPLHDFRPLQEDPKHLALAELRRLLQDEGIQWQDLPRLLETALKQVIAELPEPKSPTPTQSWQRIHGAEQPEKPSHGFMPADIDMGHSGKPWQDYKQRRHDRASDNPKRATDATEGGAPGTSWQDYKQRRDAKKQGDAGTDNRPDFGNPHNHRRNP
ncbi:late competence development ComFB family protein [Prochlorothrix hollandica]|uniref:late competence development ComFB family protein n=1 Tax=Prochlorothrix hollandica TaxID=1223 RepID=UPI00034AE5B4|nr:late competence development ComFB family protein [Prochlorothrix hollandica]